ncbi:MAG TPA: SufD family Fe-S cluster assembly protein [Acidimicrobiales bacterium]|nr:SufD family Fe-S cluster assembly protein [Acidimicrobiales bacterium]
MTRLTAAAPQFDEPSWRRAQREEALDVFRTRGLPDLADDVWRYAPLDLLKLDELELAETPAARRIETAVGGRGPAAIIALDAGQVIGVEVHPSAGGLEVSLGPPEEGLGALVGADDAFAALNLALTPGPLVVDVPAGATLDRPVVVLVECPEGASFPRVLIRAHEGASVRVLEQVSGPGSLVAGVAEYEVGEGASLEVCTVQSLSLSAWSIARTRATLARGATFSQVVVGLGGRYDRVRADAVLAGDDASSLLHTAHVGSADQVHDLRTLQVHEGRRTKSRLRSKAAVAGSAGSIYSGLIAMRKGAKKADASQINASLVLSDGAYADAVPNLDIEENDVRCSHASSVGPVDAEQRWYLESRGVAPPDAVQLILEGFFDETERLVDDAVLSASLREAIGRIDVTTALAAEPGGSS